MAINYPQRYDDDFLNTIKKLIDHVNAHGKTIQELVAEGQLTEEQYENLITTINGLVKSGYINKDDLSTGFKQEIDEFSAQLEKKADKEMLDKTNASLEQVSKKVNVLDRLPKNLSGFTSNSIIAVPENTTSLSWNASDWEQGSISASDGIEFGSAIRLRNSTDIILEPNNEYVLFMDTTDNGADSNSLAQIYEYTSGDAYLGGTGWLKNGDRFTTASNANKWRMLVRTERDNVEITTAYLKVAKPILSKVY